MKIAIHGGKTVGVDSLRKAIGKAGTLAVDVRESDEFAYEHIAGTVSFPQSRLDAEIGRLPKDKELYVFCHTGIRSAQVADILKKRGFEKVHLVEGGIAAWTGAGFPVQRSKGPVPVMRQVQIIAGSLALIGGLFPSLRWVAVIAGAGLIFAGVSGFCTMAKLLAFLPWNKPLRGSGPGCS